MGKNLSEPLWTDHRNQCDSKWFMACDSVFAWASMASMSIRTARSALPAGFWAQRSATSKFHQGTATRSKPPKSNALLLWVYIEHIQNFLWKLESWSMTVFDKLWSISIHFIHSVWSSRLHSRSRSCPDLAVSHSHAMLFPVAVDDVQEDLTETRTVGEMVMSSYRKNTCRHTVNHCDTLQSNHRQCEVFNVVCIFWWIPGAKEFVPSLT